MDNSQICFFCATAETLIVFIVIFNYYNNSIHVVLSLLGRMGICEGLEFLSTPAVGEKVREALDSQLSGLLSQIILWVAPGKGEVWRIS